jgi:predicted ATPase
MLRRIAIKGYKSLDGLELELGPLCVVFGPNASGKSNLLDALQLLSRTAMSRSLKEAFEPPYRGGPLESFAFPPNGLKGLLELESATFSLEVDVVLSPAVVAAVDQQVRQMRQKTEDTSRSSVRDSYVVERRLRYRIRVDIAPKTGLLTVGDEYLAALTSQWEPTGKRHAFLEPVKGKLHLRMEGQAHPTYHELHLDHSILSRPLYAPHYPHLVAMKEELANWHFYYFEPRERMRSLTPVKETRHIGLMGEGLAGFLNTLRALNERQFRAVESALREAIPGVSGIDLELTDLGEVELRLRENGMPVPSGVLSEGTLRVLGLLALEGAKDPPSLLGFEEPENGIHPRRLRHVAELLRTRAGTGATQVIVTTHSPKLPDFIPVESLYACAKRGGRTEIHPVTHWGAIFRDEVVTSLLDKEAEPTPISDRIFRGDFDA